MKKFISLLTVLCIVTSLCAPVAGAVSPVEEPVGNIEVINYSKHLDSADIEELKEGINATCTTASGEIIPLDCTVTVEDVMTENVNVRLAGGRTYAITVSAMQKMEPGAGSVNKDEVAAEAFISMLWTDVPGIANTLDNVSGKIYVTRGTLTSSRLFYGPSHTRHAGSIPLGTVREFNKDINFTSGSLTGSVHACYECFFLYEGFDRKLLTVCVEPSIFD